MEVMSDYRARGHATVRYGSRPASAQRRFGGCGVLNVRGNEVVGRWHVVVVWAHAPQLGYVTKLAVAARGSAVLAVSSAVAEGGGGGRVGASHTALQL